MKKVFQERVSDVDGDCARAVIASLFDKELHEVPEFKPDASQGFEIMKYFKSQGYSYSCYNRRNDCPSLEDAAKFDGGINGYFYASVKSQTFENTWHAVVVDIDLNVVHDPNPNGLALKLGPKDIDMIMPVTKWHISKDGLGFVRYDEEE